MGIENVIQIDDKQFKASINLTYSDIDGQFSFSVKPSELESFKERAKRDIDYVKAENFLIRNGFFLMDKKWNIRQNRGGGKTIKFPRYCYRDGDLLFKLGEVETNLDFTLGSLSTLKNLPDKIIPFKEISRKVYMTYDLIFVPFEGISTHTFTSKEYREFHERTVELPLFEANEDKVNRWFNNEFEKLNIKNYKINFLNWYIDKYPERAERFYRYFEQSFNILLKDGMKKGLVKFKAPKGFKEWIANKKGEDFRNYMKSIEVELKFKL
jgi:hypothetical protein